MNGPAREILACTLRAVLVFSVVMASQTGIARAAPIERDAVVKIFVTSNEMDYYHPWQSKGSQPKTGSGCVIEGRRILTNAHVVADHTFIQVRKESDPRKFTARLEALANDADLALLTVEDPEFFEDVTPLQLGELPQLKDEVTVIGFPTGGDKLSITEGVVSRIEVIPYTQSLKQLLGVQIDAAINPGNSGGPVVRNGQLAGIAMQIIGNSQNIGYMIPAPVIRHVLQDLEDEVYLGFPTLGVEYRNTENDSMRRFHRLPNDGGGILVTRVQPFSPAEGLIEEGDVITAMDDIPLGVDGTFEFRPNERMAMNHLITRQQVNAALPVELFRDGRRRKLEIPLTPYRGLVPEPMHYEKPSYYIYGGLVFTVLSADLLYSWGPQWWEKAPLDFLYYLVGEGRLNNGRLKEIVVLLMVLPDDVNVGYHGYKNEVVSKVNGQDVVSFEQFVRALDTNREPYTVIETRNRTEMILPAAKIDQRTAAIIERNNIPRAYSPDIAAWLE